MKHKNGRAKIRSKLYQRYAKTLRNNRSVLTDRYNVSEIGIFGSAVWGERTKGSDIDILVDFKEVPDLLKFIEIELYLEKLLKKKVDLVDKQGLRPELKDRILNEVVYL